MAGQPASTTGPVLRRVLTGAMLAGACLAGCPAQAQTLTILPVTFTLPARQRAATITLVNGGEAAMSIQVRAFAWSQSVDGEDRLDPTDAIAVSPPFVTVPAKGRQIVRFVLRRPAQAGESTYRILIDQIPGPAQVNEVRVALRSSLPVFAQPEGPAVPRLRFRAERADGKLYLLAANEGRRHEVVRNLTVRTASGTVSNLAAGTSPYLLPGATRRWLVADAAGDGRTLRLTAATETSGAIEQTITVASPH